MADDEHFPWSYTDCGVICICGCFLDANGICLDEVAE
jgi:hypothetical protein